MAKTSGEYSRLCDSRMNVPDRARPTEQVSYGAEGKKVLTSVEDPKRHELDLNDGGDDTHPTSSNEGEVSAPTLQK